jgi:hypothetical protein
MRGIGKPYRSFSSVSVTQLRSCGRHSPKHGTVHSGVGFTKPKTVPYEADLRRAADVLNAGSKVAILVGAGALHATNEVIAVADRLKAGAAKAQPPARDPIAQPRLQ